MKKHSPLSSLTKGVIFMTFSNLTVKAAGLFFKIPLTALIGEEGMGYFNSAYTIFTWLYMLSCAGLPTAASMLIARLPEKSRRDGAMKIFLISLTAFSALGVIGCAFLIFGADFICHIMRVENAELAMMAAAPTLLFVCQSAALRGYFQGRGELMPHSVSQVAEAVGKLALGVALAYHAVSEGKSISTAAAYAMLGIVIGVASGTFILYISFMLTKKRGGERDTTKISVHLRRLVVSSLPITLSSSVMSLAGLLDSLIMTRSLHAAGLSQAQTAAVWGNYSSLALPMFNLPPVLTLPVAYALLPSLSSALYSNDTVKAKRLCADAVRQTAFLAVPCAVGMSAMSQPILELLFDDVVAARGADMLTVLAPASMLLCMQGLFNTILQACGKERVPLYSMLCGAAVKLASTFLLTPYIGKFATPISTFLCYLTAAVISVAVIAGKTPLGLALDPRGFIMPLAASSVAVAIAVVLYPYVGTLIAIMTAVLLYFGICGGVKMLAEGIIRKRSEQT